MQRRRLVVAACVLLAMVSAALSRPGMSDGHDEPSVTSHIDTSVPAPVVSVLRRACFDCHSNETRWPWYAQLPIASHFIERDVNDGRGQLNWSLWAEYNPFDRAGILDKVCELTSTRSMPPWPYRMLHAEARLSRTDVQALCEWTYLEATRLTQGG
jgi:heme-binding protein